MTKSKKKTKATWAGDDFAKPHVFLQGPDIPLLLNGRWGDALAKLCGVINETVGPNPCIVIWPARFFDGTSHITVGINGDKDMYFVSLYDGRKRILFDDWVDDCGAEARIHVPDAADSLALIQHFAVQLGAPVVLNGTPSVFDHSEPTGGKTGGNLASADTMPSLRLVGGGHGRA